MHVVEAVGAWRTGLDAWAPFESSAAGGGNYLLRLRPGEAAHDLKFLRDDARLEALLNGPALPSGAAERLPPQRVWAAEQAIAAEAAAAERAAAAKKAPSCVRWEAFEAAEAAALLADLKAEAGAALGDASDARLLACPEGFAP